MTVNVAFPPSPRDLRLDLFRGLANWAIFFGHIPNTALTWLTTRNYGFSDGADLFVLISGYTATLVFGSMMLKRGFLIGATRLFRRVCPVLEPLIKCGQQSLEVFCVGVFLSFIAHFVLETVSGGYVAQLLVGAAGIAIMTGVAYYRSWSKRIDKPVTAH